MNTSVPDDDPGRSRRGVTAAAHRRVWPLPIVPSGIDNARHPCRKRRGKLRYGGRFALVPGESVNHRIASRGLVFAGALGLGASVAGWAQTTISVIDTGVGSSSIKVGSDGLGLIAYYDAINKDLRVAHCVDVACSSATISVVDAAGDVGQAASLAIAADGLGLISYDDATQGVLKVAHCSDAACTSAIISVLDPRAQSGSIAIGTDGLALISYRVAPPASDSGLWVAHCADTSWEPGKSSCRRCRPPSCSTRVRS